MSSSSNSASASSLEQLYLESNFEQLTAQLQQLEQKKRRTTREDLELTIFNVLSSFVSSSNTNNNDNINQNKIHQEQTILLKNILAKFEDENNEDDTYIMLSRSSFYRILATLTLVKIKLNTTSSLETNNSKNTNNTNNKIQAAGRCLTILSNCFAEAKDLSKREKVIEKLLSEILVKDKFAETIVFLVPEWMALVSGSLRKELVDIITNMSSSEGSGENFISNDKTLMKSFKIDQQQIKATLKKEASSSSFFENDKNVYLDGDSLQVKSKFRVAEGSAVLLEKTAATNIHTISNNNNNLVVPFLVSQELKRFRGSFPHFFNTLCDLAEPEEIEETSENKDDEKLNIETRFNFRQKFIIEKLEALARTRDQVSESDFPGIFSEFEKWKNNNASINNDNNEFQLRLESLAQFLFCRAAIPLTTLDGVHQQQQHGSSSSSSSSSTLMILEGDGLQFNEDSVPSARKVFRPNQVAVIRGVSTTTNNNTNSNASSSLSSSSDFVNKNDESTKNTVETGELKSFIDETNQFLADFHQPRLLFPLTAWIPHSCSPNCLAVLVSTATNNSEHQQKSSSSLAYSDLRNENYDVCLIALKEIQKDEPLTISRIGNFAPPHVRGSFCGGVCCHRAERKGKDVIDPEKKDEVAKQIISSQVTPPTKSSNAKEKETENENIKLQYLACEFCNGPLGDFLESVVCARCNVGCAPVDIPKSAREQHGKYAKCCGFCTVLLPMKRLHQDVVRHSQMAVQFLLSSSSASSKSNKNSGAITNPQLFKSIRVLHAVLMGLPLVTGNHHLRLRLALELVSAIQFQTNGLFSREHDLKSESQKELNMINSCGLGSFDDVQKAKDACKILQDTVEKVVPVLSPLRPALWMASVRIYGISARYQYFEMEQEMRKKKQESSSSSTSSTSTSSFAPPPPFNQVFMREQCPRDFSEARDRVSYAFESFSVLYSAVQKVMKGEEDSDHAKDPSVIVKKFLECYRDDLAACGIYEFVNVVEMMRV